MAAPQVENKSEMGTLETCFPNNSLQLKKTKNRNILHKCTCDTFYITTTIYMQPHD